MDLEKESQCLTCKGMGEVSVMESVYGGADSHIQAPIGSEKCEECNGTGKEQDEQIILERILDNLSKEDEEKLQDVFTKGDGWACNKDNFEDMFDGWLCNLSLDEIKNILK